MAAGEKPPVLKVVFLDKSWHICFYIYIYNMYIHVYRLTLSLTFFDNQGILFVFDIVT